MTKQKSFNILATSLYILNNYDPNIDINKIEY